MRVHGVQDAGQPHAQPHGPLGGAVRRFLRVRVRGTPQESPTARRSAGTRRPGENTRYVTYFAT